MWLSGMQFSRPLSSPPPPLKSSFSTLQFGSNTKLAAYPSTAYLETTFVSDYLHNPQECRRLDSQLIPIESNSQVLEVKNPIVFFPLGNLFLTITYKALKTDLL